MCFTESKVVEGHAPFTSGFLARSFQDDGNLLTSPFSVFILLSALFGANGPKGNTGREICRALYGPHSDCPAGLRKQSRALAKRYYASLTSVKTQIRGHEEHVVRLENAAFVQENYELEELFEKYFKKSGSAIKEVNFVTGSAVSQINQWVDDNTDGLIPKFYSSPGDISPDTRLVLVNALLVKDEWEKDFIKFKTRLQAFHTDQSTTTQIDMMHSIEMLPYMINEDDGFHVISKSLKSKRFQFVVFLPIQRFGLRQVEEHLSSSFNWKDLANMTSTKMVGLSLPRFQLTHELDVKQTLEGMGVNDLFSFEADLSGVTKKEALYVKKATQKSVLKVNEKGVEAAAVTGMQIVPMSLLRSEVDFVVDEPFLCSIYDTKLQLPLFVARVISPEKLEAPVE